MMNQSMLIEHHEPSITHTVSGCYSGSPNGVAGNVQSARLGAHPSRCLQTFVCIRMYIHVKHITACTSSTCHPHAHAYLCLVYSDEVIGASSIQRVGKHKATHRLPKWCYSFIMNQPIPEPLIITIVHGHYSPLKSLVIVAILYSYS